MRAALAQLSGFHPSRRISIPSLRNGSTIQAASQTELPTSHPFGVLGVAFGSIIAIFLNDRLGRHRAYRVYVTIWAISILMYIFSSKILRLMLFARIFDGLGSGGITVYAPMFLSEIAPAKSRRFVISANTAELSLTW